MTPEIIKIDTNTKIKITRYDNGEVMSKTAYVNDKKHGLDSEWLVGGQKRWEGPWKDGKSHGMTTAWGENGEKAWESMWKCGKKHGMETGWYEDGQKRWEEMWKEDKQHGMYSGWYEDGQKRWEVYYLDNEVYAEIEWDERGNAKTLRIPEKAPSKTNPVGKSKIISKGK